MLRPPVFLAAAVLLTIAIPAAAQEAADNARNGAQGYRICAACHSLQPGVHLSGPSLAGLWGRKSASVDDFGRYSEALIALDVVWDEDTLNAWLAHPQAMAAGTTMTFQGIEDDGMRGAIIAFLRVAMAEGGHERVVEQRLIPKAMADGQMPPDLSGAQESQRVSAIRHCRDAFHVTTGDGAKFPFWETNVRLKIDTSKRGPGQGDPVLLSSGMGGDRVSIVFPSLAALREALAEEC